MGLAKCTSKAVDYVDKDQNVAHLLVFRMTHQGLMNLFSI